jgi:hypothetical protein
MFNGLIDDGSVRGKIDAHALASPACCCDGLFHELRHFCLGTEPEFFPRHGNDFGNGPLAKINKGIYGLTRLPVSRRVFRGGIARLGGAILDGSSTGRTRNETGTSDGFAVAKTRGDALPQPFAATRTASRVHIGPSVVVFVVRTAYHEGGVERGGVGGVSGDAHVELGWWAVWLVIGGETDGVSMHVELGVGFGRGGFTET